MNETTPARPALRALFALAGGLLLISACGGGDDPAAAQPAAGTDGSEATAQATAQAVRPRTPRQPAWPRLLPTSGAQSLPAWGLAPRAAPLLPAMAPPGYLDFAVDPRTTVFGSSHVPTEVARISDEAAFGLSRTRFGHAYAKVSPWNADGSLALVFATGAGQATRAVLLDGKTFAMRKIVPGIFAGGRWSNLDPSTFYEIGEGGTPRLDATNVETGVRRVVKDFAGQGYDAQARTSMFGGEGNQSESDRIWALQLHHPERGWELVIWDRVADAVRGRIALPSQADIGATVDDWSITPKGNFVTTYSSRTWTNADGASVPAGHNVWSLDGRYLRSVPGEPAGHLDLCLDASGNEVVAFIGSKHAPNGKTGQTWRIDGSAGDTTVDQFVDGTVGWNFHISCQSTARPGYMVVSTFPSPTPQSYDSFPMWNHVFAVRLDGSKRIAVIANAHHDVTSADGNLYDRSSFAVANRDLSAVWFTAAWDRADGTVHSYVARPKRP